MRTNYRTEPNRRNGVIYERIYEVIVYEEDGCIESFMRTDIKGKRAYALHDNDLKKDGTPKKKHIHLIYWFDREKSIKALSKDIGIPENRIEWKADIYGALQYLVHKNHPDKYQYDISIIQTDIENINEYIYPIEVEKSSETDDLRVIMSYIRNHIDNIRLYDIYCFCIDNDCWSSYRRNYSIIKDILREERYTTQNKFIRLLADDNHINRKTGEVTDI